MVDDGRREYSVRLRCLQGLAWIFLGEGAVYRGRQWGLCWREKHGMRCGLCRRSSLFQSRYRGSFFGAVWVSERGSIWKGGMSTSSSSQRCGSATVRFMMTFRVSAASSNSIP